MRDIIDGLFDPHLRVGVVSSVTAFSVRVNLQEASEVGGSRYKGARYGLGEVGEFVLIEGEIVALLGRIIEVTLPEKDRLSVDEEGGWGSAVAAYAQVQLLGTVSLEHLAVIAGVPTYPRLGDRVYSAPDSFLSSIPLRMERDGKPPSIALRIGSVSSVSSSGVLITPERLFGRHCAVLGATGGGKSYTLSRLVEECLRFNSKLILLDATGEFKDFVHHTTHCYLGTPIDEPGSSTKCSLPPSSFTEADFMALFEPAGKTQAPKLRAAIRSLKLIGLAQSLADPSKPGLLIRAGRRRTLFVSIEAQPDISRKLDDPATPFNPHLLSRQIEQECVKDYPDRDSYGVLDEQSFSYCMTLVTRIQTVLHSRAMDCVFGTDPLPTLISKIDEFLDDGKRLLRISLEGIPFEYSAREVIANAIGRFMLGRGREGKFREKPVIVLVDEAHNFLGRNLGGEESSLKLDSFELIAKEGRKYGLNLCLATQRPRDITDGVLSQMGTLIVHRLTNDGDRTAVERACGAIDRSASSFLPNLAPGEAAIVGVDFPIPLTIQIDEPTTPPISRGANYQDNWRIQS